MKTSVQRILVPIDLTDSSIAAVDYAVKLAQPLQATLTLLYIVEPPVVNERATLDEQLQNFARLFVPGNVPIELVVGEGKPLEQILGEVREMNPDLIVMVSRPGAAPRHWFRRPRSMTAELLRGTACPVVVLRDNEPALSDYAFL